MTKKIISCGIFLLTITTGIIAQESVDSTKKIDKKIVIKKAPGNRSSDK